MNTCLYLYSRGEPMSHLPGYPGYRRRLNGPTIIQITMAALFKERVFSPRGEQTGEEDKQKEERERERRWRWRRRSKYTIGDQ